MKPITEIAFVPHHEDEYEYQYSKSLKCWVLTNRNGLSINFYRFNDGLINMCILTDTPIEKMTIL